MSTDRIEKKVLLHAPVTRVWTALSDSTEFGTWFGMKFDGAFRPGALLRGVIVPTKVNEQVAKAQKEYEGMRVQITMEKMEPELAFSCRCHPFAIDKGVDYSEARTTLIQFVIEQNQDRVLLTVTESGFDH